MALTKANNRMIDGAMINVLDYGAVGDGSTDDTAAFVAAIADAASNSRKKTVYIPTRDYVLSELTLTSGVTLYGEEGNITTGGLGRTKPFLDFSGLSADEKAITVEANCTLINLVVFGPDRLTSGTYGVYTGETRSEADTDNLGSNLTLKNVRVEGFETGAIITRWNNLIRDCNFYFNTDNLVLGDSTNNTKVLTSYFNSELGASPCKNIFITSGAGNNIVIRDSHLEPNFEGIDIQGGTDITIDGNYFEDTNSAFIICNGDGNTVITNNFFADISANASTNNNYGINILGGYCYIDNNTMNAYNSGANTGLKTGIRLTSVVTANFIGAYIGQNQILAYRDYDNIGSVLSATDQAKITSINAISNSNVDEAYPMHTQVGSRIGVGVVRPTVALEVSGDTSTDGNVNISSLQTNNHAVFSDRPSLTWGIAGTKTIDVTTSTNASVALKVKVVGRRDGGTAIDYREAIVHFAASGDAILGGSSGVTNISTINNGASFGIAVAATGSDDIYRVTVTNNHGVAVKNSSISVEALAVSATFG